MCPCSDFSGSRKPFQEPHPKAPSGVLEGSPDPFKHSSGFTLIEIMVVVVILAILATLVVPKVMDRPDQARIVKIHQDLQGIDSALQLYKLDNYTYPTTEQGLEALVRKPNLPPAAPHWKEGGYLARLPVDPWDRPYQYLSPGQHGPFDLYTLGADGQEGGEKMDADIGNWDLKE